MDGLACHTPHVVVRNEKQGGGSDELALELLHSFHLAASTIASHQVSVEETLGGLTGAIHLQDRRNTKKFLYLQKNK